MKSNSLQTPDFLLDSRLHSLTNGEWDVMLLLVEDLSNAEIANRLYVTPNCRQRIVLQSPIFQMLCLSKKASQIVSCRYEPLDSLQELTKRWGNRKNALQVSTGIHNLTIKKNPIRFNE